MHHFNAMAYLPRFVSLAALALTACIVPKSVGEDPPEDTSGATTEAPSDVTGATTEAPNDATGSIDSTEGPGDSTGSDDTGAPLACPMVPNFLCSEPYDCPDGDTLCGGLFSEFDASGCLRAECTADSDCAADEVCFVPNVWGGCVSSGVLCQEVDGACECAKDADCGGSYCAKKVDAPPAACPEFADADACLDAGCSEFDGGTRLVQKGDSCECEASGGHCLWFEGGESGGSASPAAFFHLGTSEVAVFSTDFIEPPLGWRKCDDPLAPSACSCFVPGEDPCP